MLNTTAFLVRPHVFGWRQSVPPTKSPVRGAPNVSARLRTVLMRRPAIEESNRPAESVAGHPETGRVSTAGPQPLALGTCLIT